MLTNISEKTEYHITSSPEETKRLGSEFSKDLNKGDCIALIGELGSGKTCFVQGIAKGIGVRQAVNSPTFKIISEYNGKKTKFYHIDFYRLQRIEEVIELGLEDLFSEHAIIAIEWADKFLDYLHFNFEVLFSIIADNNRKIEIRRIKNL